MITFIFLLSIGLILAFNVSHTKAVGSLAMKKGVQVLEHNVIYKLLEQLKVSSTLKAPRVVTVLSALRAVGSTGVPAPSRLGGGGRGGGSGAQGVPAEGGSGGGRGRVSGEAGPARSQRHFPYTQEWKG